MEASEVQVTTVRYEGGPNPIRLSVVGEHIHIHRVRYSLHATVFVTASALAWPGRYEPDMQQAGWSFEVETNTMYLSRDDGGDGSYAARKWAKIHACMAAAQWLHDAGVAGLVTAHAHLVEDEGAGLEDEIDELAAKLDSMRAKRKELRRVSTALLGADPKAMAQDPAGMQQEICTIIEHAEEVWR